jgi:NAD(P)-dependent dehydrogenase (short-subunit alcohol dehydrogenase family)
VDSLVRSWTLHGKKLDLLVNNAAVCRWSETQTADGFEESLQVNCLAPLRLTFGLSPVISASRLATVLNIGTVPVHLGSSAFTLYLPEARYDMVVAYRRSKAMLGALSLEMAKLPRFEGSRFFYMNPGLMRTRLGVENWIAKFGSVISYPFAQDPMSAAEKLLKNMELKLHNSVGHWPQHDHEVHDFIAPALSDSTNRLLLWRNTCSVVENHQN